ncbi:MAG: hypothetical protein EPO46_09535 [Lysobacter sp.]|nr:MAG: hypothetical protein EPO46_09535 [Lysobacter sp.]
MVKQMKNPTITLLATALAVTIGLASTPVSAQRAHGAQARVQARVATNRATEAAREARQESNEAKHAAKQAARMGGDGVAHIAHEASVAAEDAKNDAIEASQRAMGAGASAESGFMKRDASDEARAQARASERARDRAHANSAVARTQADIAVTPPVRRPMSTHASDNARIATSYPGAMADVRSNGAASSDFAIDFRTLDADRDGVISQAEASNHAFLSSRFQTADRNGDGRLTRLELIDWAGVPKLVGSR